MNVIPDHDFPQLPAEPDALIETVLATDRRVLLVGDGRLRMLDQPSQAIGIHAGTKPVITEIPVAASTWVVAFTDGLLDAGRRFGQSLDISNLVASFILGCAGDAPELADDLLNRAVELDQGRPQDDTSVLVLALVPKRHLDKARRMTVRFPLPPF